MLGMLIAAASLGVTGAHGEFHGMYSPNRDQRPIATVPGPVENGRLFITQPIIGPHSAPAVPYFAAPGPEYYGAIDVVDASVPVRVGNLVVSISPWERIDQPGLRRFEEARQFWLHENNFTGGVRTVINDLHLWEPPRARRAQAEDVQTFIREPDGVPMPRATIQLPEDAPRQRRPLRVDGAGPSDSSGVVTFAGGQARISWPMAAPAEVVAQSRKPSGAVAAAR